MTFMYAPGAEPLLVVNVTYMYNEQQYIKADNWLCAVQYKTLLKLMLTICIYEALYYDMTTRSTNLCPQLWKFVFNLSIHLLISHNMKQKYEQTLQDDSRMKLLKNDKHPCHQLYLQSRLRNTVVVNLSPETHWQ